MTASGRGLVILLATVSLLQAETDPRQPAPPPAARLLSLARQHRSTHDLALKARLFVSRTEQVPVELLVHQLPDGRATLFRGPDLELLILQSADGTTRYYRLGTGPLTGAAIHQPILESQFAPADLAMAFLHWPSPRYLEERRQRGRTCHVLEVRHPDPAATAAVVRMELWLDREFGGILRADGFNADDDLVRQLVVTSFRRVDQTWIPRGLTVSFRPPGQSLPAAEKSRLEVYQGDYHAELDPALFNPDRF